MAIKEMPMEVEKRVLLSAFALLECDSNATRKVIKLVLARLKMELTKVESLVASEIIVVKLGTKQANDC